MGPFRDGFRLGRRQLQEVWCFFCEGQALLQESLSQKDSLGALPLMDNKNASEFFSAFSTATLRRSFGHCGYTLAWYGMVVDARAEGVKNKVRSRLECRKGWVRFPKRVPHYNERISRGKKNNIYHPLCSYLRFSCPLQVGIPSF